MSQFQKYWHFFVNFTVPQNHFTASLLTFFCEKSLKNQIFECAPPFPPLTGVSQFFI